MSESFLGLAVASTLYFVFGSRLEERRLAAEFGPAYTAYRQRVPWLLPGLKPRD
jgi:protein-S-isoprenylcysteine O-methyltransferase Ste14